MRSAFKRIFRRKADKKKKGGSREPTDDSTPDEIGDSKPVSLFQPKQQGRIEHTPAPSPAPPSSIRSAPASKPSVSGKAIEQKIAKSTSAQSIIAPIREEFDQGSVTSAQLSPVSTRDVKSTSDSPPSDAMKSPLSEEEMPDGPTIANNYAAIPVLEQTKLPRGGVSVETKAVGRVQVR